MVAMNALPVIAQVVVRMDPQLATPRDGVGSDDPDFIESNTRGLRSEALPW